MNIAQLNLRGRMAYGTACVLALLQHNGVGAGRYKEDLKCLAAFTAAENLAEWDRETKQYIYGKYTDEQIVQGVPKMLDALYWIGASELYGQPSGCAESEKLLAGIVETLRKDNVPLPDIEAYAAHVLQNPVGTDAFFGPPFSIEL